MAEAPKIDIEVDPNDLYREEVFTDRKAGSIRRLTPIKSNGDTDTKRPVIYIGQAQLLTPVGAVPLSFEIPANSLDEAARKFSKAAGAAVEETQKELEELRREAASSIVVPRSGDPGFGGGGPGIPGGGKIKLP